MIYEKQNKNENILVHINKKLRSLYSIYIHVQRKTVLYSTHNK